MPIVQRIMTEGVPHSFEDYFPNLDKYFRFTSVPLGDYFITTGADVTSIKKAEQALRNSEALLRTVLDNCPDPIFLKDLDCRLLLANRATFAVVGKPAEAVIGKTDAEFYDDPATGRAIMENDRRIMKSGQVEVVEESISDPAGTRVYLSAKAPYRDAEGRVIGLVGVTKEITERKQAENALKKSEERFRIAERLAKMGHFEWDVVDNVIVASSSLERIYALEPGGFKGGYEDWLKMVYSEDRVKVRDIIYLAFAEKRCEERFEFRIVHPDGDVRWISTEATATYDRSGSPLAVIGAMTDITDRKRAEESLKKVNDELEKRVQERTLDLSQAVEKLRESETQVRFFASQCLTAQETERKRVAGELHDSIASSLGAMKIRIEKVADEMKQGLCGPDSLQDLASNVAEMSNEVRRIMADLRPSILDDLGIIAAMNWLCREYKKTYPHISVENQIGVSEQDVPDSLRTPIFRISQEAVNNIAKYSKASIVNLSLGRKMIKSY